MINKEEKLLVSLMDLEIDFNFDLETSDSSILEKTLLADIKRKTLIVLRSRLLDKNSKVTPNICLNLKLVLESLALYKLLKAGEISEEQASLFQAQLELQELSSLNSLKKNVIFSALTKNDNKYLDIRTDELLTSLAKTMHASKEEINEAYVKGNPLLFLGTKLKKLPDTRDLIRRKLNTTNKDYRNSYDKFNLLVHYNYLSYNENEVLDNLNYEVKKVLDLVYQTLEEAKALTLLSSEDVKTRTKDYLEEVRNTLNKDNRFRKIVLINNLASMFSKPTVDKLSLYNISHIFNDLLISYDLEEYDQVVSIYKMLVEYLTIFTAYLDFDHDGMVYLTTALYYDTTYQVLRTMNSNVKEIDKSIDELMGSFFVDSYNNYYKDKTNLSYTDFRNKVLNKSFYELYLSDKTLDEEIKDFDLATATRMLSKEDTREVASINQELLDLAYLTSITLTHSYSYMLNQENDLYSILSSLIILWMDTFIPYIFKKLRDQAGSEEVEQEVINLELSYRTSSN